MRDLLDQLGLRAVVKSSGSKGIHLSVGLRPAADAEPTKAFAVAGAHPRVPRPRACDGEHGAGSNAQGGSSSTGARTIVTRRQCARTRCAVTPAPGASTPISWDEVEDLADGGDPRAFAFTPAEVIERVEELGDLYADSLAGDHDLPELG